jgi:hypothetical protein
MTLAKAAPPPVFTVQQQQLLNQFAASLTGQTITSPIIATDMTSLPAADFFLIEGNACPGRCRLKSLNSPRGWDQRKGAGMSGGSLTPTGDPLSSIVFEIMIWEGLQWQQFTAYAKQYFSEVVRFLPGSGDPRALGILHPILSAPPWQIQAVVVEDCTISDPDPEGEPIYIVELKLLQYRKPVLVKGRPDQPVPPATTAQPSAQDALDASNADWFAQVKDMARQAGLPTSTPSGNVP